MSDYSEKRMNFKWKPFAEKQQYTCGALIVSFSDNTIKTYDAFKLGCEWVKMSNDAFYSLYGFNFNPHEIPGLYERCAKEVWKQL